MGVNLPFRDKMRQDCVSYPLLSVASPQFGLFGHFPSPHSSVDPHPIAIHNPKSIACETVYS